MGVLKVYSLVIHGFSSSVLKYNQQN